MIPVLFNILFFLIPLIFFKNTSELFEFNKIVTLYALTTIIASIWIINSIRAKKLIFRRTLLDWPLVVYLIVLLLSSLVSIDPRTSWLGYYGRFNGGLISQICYAVLYWAFVSNMNSEKARTVVKYALLSTLIASILAILEHFKIFTTCAPIIYSKINSPENQTLLEKFVQLNIGEKFNYLFKNSCWVQDVQNRVFSTLGQPNWLAALLTALIPISWAYSLRHTAYSMLSVLFFITLLFTKSRSGLLAFGIEAIVFWSFVFWQDRFKQVKEFLVLFIATVILFFFFNFQKISPNPLPKVTTTQTNSLETGGTESGTIRKYVWLGAFEVFKHYPILGTGPETFAFSFPMYKPALHNLTSEWDYLYNKVHNEYLNYLANTGLLGFIAYLSVVIVGFIILFRSKRFDLLGGYLAILVTNFFGFSVVPVSLLFFLFPAIAIASSAKDKELVHKVEVIGMNQKILILLVSLATLAILHTVYSYWQADIYYNQAKEFYKQGKDNENHEAIDKALSISPKEPIYVFQLSLVDQNPETVLRVFKMAPLNQNVRRLIISFLINNTNKDEDYLKSAESILEESTYLFPNDPKVYYQLAIVNLKQNNVDDAIKNLEKAIELKSNYKEGRFLLGAIYKDLKENVKSKEQYEYILENIDSNDDLIKKYLDELN